MHNGLINPSGTWRRGLIKRCGIFSSMSPRPLAKSWPRWTGVWVQRPASDPMARVRDEVLPDVAIYRSQLINTIREGGMPTASLFRPHARVPSRSAADPLFRVVMSLGRASAQLAAYIEPREHGAMSPASSIQEAIQDLHDSAEALATYFAVDLASAHQARLEALLGAPLPASLVEREREDP